MTVRILSLNLAENREMRAEIPRNHVTLALAKPPMKKASVPAGRLARKAPSIMVPSMMA